MKLGKFYFVNFLLLSGIFFGCSDDRTAGGVTDIGNSIAGRIYLADGETPAAHARIVAYEDSWKNSNIADSVETWSDSLGNFAFDNSAEKMQLLYASQNAENFLAASIQDSMKIILGNSKSLSGKIESEFSGSVRIVGTNLSAALNSDGEFSFDSIPAGNISLVFVKNSAPQSHFEFSANSAKEKISLPALKAFSESDSLLVFADASAYADTSLGISLSDAATAISVSLKSVPSETLRGFVLPVKFNNQIDFSLFAEPDSFKITDERGNDLSFEVDYWTPQASQGVLWVRLDSLLADCEKVNLYVIHSNDSKKSRAYLPADSILAALHLFGDEKFNSSSDTSKPFGFIGYGKKIHAGEFISLDSLNPFTHNFTLSLWAYWNGKNGHHQILFTKRASPDSLLFQWYYDTINSAFSIYNVAHWDSIPEAVSAVDTNSWKMLSLVSKNDSIAMFVNGEQIGEAISFPLYKILDDIPFLVGGNEVEEESWNGAFDEIRVVQKARSAEWLRLEYETQSAAKN